MRPGPTHIIACPSCGGLHQELTFLSGNDFGARHWTDGKVDAPMFPVTPRFVVCVHCKKGFFTEDAKTIGNIPYGPDNSLFPSDWQNAPRILWPHIEDYVARLTGEGKETDAERVRYLRIHLWWSLNDILSSRDTPTFKSRIIDNPVSDEKMVEYRRLFTENLNALIDLFSASVGDVTLKAEALRELGRFDETLAILPDSYNAPIHDMIRELARKKDSRVAELPPLS